MHFLKLVGSFFQLLAAMWGVSAASRAVCLCCYCFFFSALGAGKSFLLVSAWFPKEIESCGITLFLGVSLPFQLPAHVQRNMAEIEDSIGGCSEYCGRKRSRGVIQ